MIETKNAKHEIMKIWQRGPRIQIAFVQTMRQKVTLKASKVFLRTAFVEMMGIKKVTWSQTWPSSRWSYFFVSMKKVKRRENLMKKGKIGEGLQYIIAYLEIKYYDMFVRVCILLMKYQIQRVGSTV